MIKDINLTINGTNNLAEIYANNGGVLAPNGKIYGIPYSSTTVLEIDTKAETILETCLSPYINKF